MIGRTAGAFLLAWVALPGMGCALMGSRETPQRDPAVDPGSQHLRRSEPASAIEAGGGEKRTLLEVLKDVEEQRDKLQADLAEMRRRTALLESRTGAIEEEVERERALRKGAEAERDELRALIEDREVRLLNVALQKTRIEQEFLQERIRRAERELELAGRSAAPTVPIGPPQDPSGRVAPSPPGR